MARVFNIRNFMSARVRGLPDVEPPKERAQPRQKRSEPFVLVPLAATALAAKATRSTKLFVWLMIQYRVWQEKNQTVALSNRSLAPYGISPDAKLRALGELETAGLIRVNRKGTKTVLITLLDKETAI
jgi:hypothetical protein